MIKKARLPKTPKDELTSATILLFNLVSSLSKHFTYVKTRASSCRQPGGVLEVLLKEDLKFYRRQFFWPRQYLFA
jgi:hypothetical protein